ncbi:MAG: NAD(P)/FAD-dependent oxidoreductase [Verrucomicrobiota bacterium]
MPSQKQIAIIGGGAAGFFTAITAAEADPNARVTLYERSRNILAKVKISGGGRCNVTHSCFDPSKLATYYPRGGRELRGAFHRWQPQDMIDWLGQHGVRLKTEQDGRMFPVTDRSQTIIDCFTRAADKAGVQLILNTGLDQLVADPEGGFTIELSDGSQTQADKVCITAGSLKTSPLKETLEDLGHTIEPLAPSLFAFNLQDKRTHGLAGLSVQNAKVKCLHSLHASTNQKAKPSTQMGPILITHRGLSGPAILRLSAWEARRLQAQDYKFEISVNWLGNVSENQLQEEFSRLRKTSGKTAIRQKCFDALPRRLWERLVEAAGIGEEQKWAQLRTDEQTTLSQQLIDCRFTVQGKTTNKEEFVTCGGVKLKEINFKTMESRTTPGLYFAGECLDIDGVTGGFNFQAAWTGGRIAGLAMAGTDNA